MTANDEDWGWEWVGGCSRSLFCFVTAAGSCFSPAWLGFTATLRVDFHSIVGSPWTVRCEFPLCNGSRAETGRASFPRPAAAIRPCLCLQAACFHCKRRYCVIHSGEETVAPEDWQADGEAASQEAGGQILAYLDFSNLSLKNPVWMLAGYCAFECINMRHSQAVGDDRQH